ncbi:hypothetical protein QE379_001043 [Sphingomonas sp. SORGH_AS 879]|nr:hypothetical protein [Sphingomonas sp. SORGH_AS_0879]
MCGYAPSTMLSVVPQAQLGEDLCSPFLPKLCLGRGTARQSRVVEGHSCKRWKNPPPDPSFSS